MSWNVEGMEVTSSICHILLKDLIYSTAVLVAAPNVSHCTKELDISRFYPFYPSFLSFSIQIVLGFVVEAKQSCQENEMKHCLLKKSWYRIHAHNKSSS